ncbi:MAG: T9SS type A sorting domain-containing protein [Chitinophagales bacterium]|nr:T9SS type A sorting domain-containing protein [Chitinophagales bacterium]
MFRISERFSFIPDGRIGVARNLSANQWLAIWSVKSVAIQSDGKIVVAGYSGNGLESDFAVARYNVDSRVGIENTVEESTLNISPNPFGNELLIKGTKEKGEIIISDVLGKEILRQKTFSLETKINTEKLLLGFYVLNYTEGNKTEIMTIVKF